MCCAATDSGIYIGKAEGCGWIVRRPQYSKQTLVRALREPKQSTSGTQKHPPGTLRMGAFCMGHMAAFSSKYSKGNTAQMCRWATADLFRRKCVIFSCHTQSMPAKNCLFPTKNLRLNPHRQFMRYCLLNSAPVLPHRDARPGKAASKPNVRLGWDGGQSARQPATGH